MAWAKADIGWVGWNETLVASAERTATSASSVIEGYGPAKTLRVQLNVTAASGTTPTLNVLVEDTLDGTTFNTVGTFAQRTATGREVINVTAPFADRLRVSWTIAGTTPSFTFAVDANVEATTISVDEYAVLGAPERAVLRKGKPMKALLTKKWGGGYAGQVLTNVEKGSIPADVATFYEDDQPTPNDIVKDQEADVNHLPVINDAIDPARVASADKANQGKLEAAQNAPAALSDQVSAAEQVETQRRAREADQFAGKQAKKAKAGLPKVQKAKMNAGKEHGVK